MKFIVSSSQLLKQLQVLGGVINSNNTLPILDNFLFEVSENQLKISASDLETTMSAVVTIESDTSGSIAISARLLLDTLKTFPDQPLTFKTEGDSIIEISSDQGKYDMAYFGGDEFPKSVSLPSPSKTIIPSNILATAISKTIFAAAKIVFDIAVAKILDGIIVLLGEGRLTDFGNSSPPKYAYFGGDEFPKSVSLPSPSKTIIPSNILATAISKTIFAAAKIVFDIAVAKILDGIIVLLGEGRLTDFGNSSPPKYAMSYLPWSELISMMLSPSVLKVNGWSGNVFKVSRSNLADIAIEPDVSDSIVTTALIVVSKSDAEIFNWFSETSNKKLSNIGKVLLLLITPPKTCSCFNNCELDTINFILIFVKVWFNYKDIGN